MENTLVADQAAVEHSTGFTKEEKKAIITEALLGTKSLSEILIENGITEKEFYLWMAQRLKKDLQVFI
ncbi:MAG: hypothetical protein V4677_01720 [Bacteroidota bacterium]